MYETDHKGVCQSEREQQGEFEPVYCLFIFLKSWCNLLAHMKIEKVSVRVGVCIVTCDVQRSRWGKGLWLWSAEPDGSAAFILKARIIFRYCCFMVLINPANDSRAGPSLARRQFPLCFR